MVDGHTNIYYFERVSFQQQNLIQLDFQLNNDSTILDVIIYTDAISYHNCTLTFLQKSLLF